MFRQWVRLRRRVGYALAEQMDAARPRSRSRSRQRSRHHPTDRFHAVGLLTLDRFLLLTTATLAVVWASVLVPSWAKAARKRSGTASLEALLLVAGPVQFLMLAAYPRNGAEPGRALLMLSQAVTLTIVTLAGVILFEAMRRPSQGRAWLIFALMTYYAAGVASGLLGVVPALPRTYWQTPLVMIAVVAHGGVSLNWLLAFGRLVLRIIVGFSLAAAIALPSLAFNLEESRTVLGVHRLQGIIGHPNGLAFLAAAGVLFEMRRPGGIRRLWLAATLATVIFAQSRTASIALALGVLLIARRGGPLLRVAAGGAAGCLAFLEIVAPITAGRVVGSLGQGDVGTLNGRTEVWDAALHGYQLNPLFGYGPTLLNAEYRAQYLGDFDAAAQAHNQFIQSLGETGLIGLCALIVLLSTLSMYAVRGRRSADGLGIGLLVLLVAQCVTETPLRPSVVSISLVLTVAVIAAAAPTSSGTSTASPSRGLALPPRPLRRSGVSSMESAD